MIIVTFGVLFNILHFDVVSFVMLLKCKSIKILEIIMLDYIVDVVVFGQSDHAGTVKSNDNTNDVVLCFDELVVG